MSTGTKVKPAKVTYEYYSQLIINHTDPLPFFPEDADENCDDERAVDDGNEDDSDDDFINEEADGEDLFESGCDTASECSSTDHGDDGDNDTTADGKKTSKKPSLPFKNEISHVLNRHPELAKNNRVIGAIDAGIRYPIALATKERSADYFRTYKVRKTNLYHYENEECRKLEYMKSKRQDVVAAEQKLGSTGTKNSHNFELFVDGYFKDWLAVHRTLFDFYGQPQIRNMRYHKAWARKKLYDAHAATILDMLGLKPSSKINNPGEVILVVEDEMIEVKHKNRRPSKHAAFWRYFLRKVRIIN